MHNFYRRNMNVDPPLVASPEELEVNHGVKRQIFATLAVSFAALNAGLTIGWAQTGKIDISPGSNSTQDHDQSEKRINQMLITSFYSTIIAAVFLATLSRFFGRHLALLVASVISVIMGTLLILDNNTPAVGWWLSGSVVISGITFGPMLLSESVHRGIRGALMSVCFFQINFGIFLALTIGSYLNSTAVGWCLTVLYMVQFFLIFLIAESPIFLAWKSNQLRAEGSLFWYCGGDRSIALGQLSTITAYYGSNNNSLVATLKDSEIRNALGLVAMKGILFIVGYWVLVEFRIKMYLCANGAMSQNSVDVLVISVQAVVSLLMIIFVDSLGRKTLMYISHTVNPCVMLISWIYFSWIWSPEAAGFYWFPILCSIVYIASYTIGLAAYFSVLVNEVFPLPVKDIVSTFAGLLVAGAVLMPIWCRNVLDYYIRFGFDNLKYFIITEFTGCLWTWLYAEETKGKPLMILHTW